MHKEEILVMLVTGNCTINGAEKCFCLSFVNMQFGWIKNSGRIPTNSALNVFLMQLKRLSSYD